MRVVSSSVWSAVRMGRVRVRCPGCAGSGCGLAEVGEPDGVAAGFGEEVAAEAEHVRPAAQPGVVRVLAERPAGVDEPFGVGAVRVGVQVDGFGGDAGGGVAGDLGAFGGVLGEVAATARSVTLPVPVRVMMRMSISVPQAMSQPPAGPGGAGAEADVGGGLADGVVEVGDGEAGRRGRLVGVGGVVAVEADQGVEVDGAAGLVFGGFAVRDRTGSPGGICRRRDPDGDARRRASWPRWRSMACLVRRHSSPAGCSTRRGRGSRSSPGTAAGRAWVVAACRASRRRAAVCARGGVAAGVAGLGPGSRSGTGRRRCAGGPGGCGPGRRTGR